jgi:O-antigen ligase/Flp pilus assembly protein TadD
MRPTPRQLARAGTLSGALGVVALLGYPHPIAYVGLVGLVALGAHRWRTRGRPLPASPLTIPFGLYFAGAMLGLYATIRPAAAGVRLFGLLAALGAYYVVLDRTTSLRAARRTLAGAIVLALLGVACLPLLRGPTGHVPGPLHEWFGLLWDVSGPLWRRVQALEDIGQRYRFTSSGLGMLAGYGACLTLGPLLAGRTRRARLLSAGVAACFAAFLVLSGSRTAQLSAAVTFLAFGVRQRRWLGAVVLLLVAAAAGFVAGLPWLEPLGRSDGPLALLSRFGGSSESFRQRLDVWGNALFLAGDFRFTGVGLGLGSVEAVYHAYFWPTRLEHVHSIFVQSYLEQGLLGLAGLLAIVAVAVVASSRGLARLSDPTARAIAVSSAAACLVLLLNGLMEIGPVTSIGMVLLLGTLGLGGAVGRLAPAAAGGRPAVEPAPAEPPAAALSGLVTLAVVVAAVAPPALSPFWSRSGHGSSGPRRSVNAIAATFSVNMGALQVVHATLGQEPPPRRQARVQAACAHLSTAERLDPRNPAIYRNLAAVALAASRPAVAWRLLGRAETLLAPGDARSRFQIARLHQESGDVDRALVAWARVDPAVGAANGAGPGAQVTRWGEALVRSGRWSDAAKVNRAAVQLTPTDPAPYRALAVAVGKGQGEEAALATMGELARAYPDVPWPYEETAKMYVSRGLGAEARAWDQRARAVYGSAEWKARRAAAEGWTRPAVLAGEPRAGADSEGDLYPCGADAVPARTR